MKCKSIIKCLGCLFFVAVLNFSCAHLHNKQPRAKKIYGYDFRLTPDVSNHYKNDEKLIFIDEHIQIEFSILPFNLDNEEAKYHSYSELEFELFNKSDEEIVIDWNKVSFIDFNGSSGNLVMHAGIKYSDCSNFKTPTTILPHGHIKDVIVPCYGIQFISIGSFNEWISLFLPDPTKFPHVEFGVYFPIKIKDEQKNYKFSFTGDTKLKTVYFK